MSGILTLVATPIGNLGDMTYRGVEVLRAADVIACEDTRHSRKLLQHYAIESSKLMAVHEHNEAAMAERIVELVREGSSVALITDAGTPAISDPGERVVRALIEAGLPVTIAPGASASVSALAISGLPTTSFTFLGFIERKGRNRAQSLRQIVASPHTTILYESPQRLAATVAELTEACGEDREITVVRELTKLHETVLHGKAGELSGRLASAVTKGECVILVAPAPPSADVTDQQIDDALATARAAGLSARDAVKEVSEQLGVARNRVYERSANP